MIGLEKILIAGGIAAGAYALSQEGGEADLPADPVSGASTPRQRRLVNIGFYAKVSPNATGYSQRIAGNGKGYVKTSAGYSQEDIDSIKARVKAEFDKLDASAKEAGCKKLNEQIVAKGGTPIDCASAKFETVVAAAAAAGATAGCAATAVGAPLAPLCGIAGAYLGKEIAPYIQGALEDTKDFLADKASDLENWLTNIW